jgi:nitrilase
MSSGQEVEENAAQAKSLSEGLESVDLAVLPECAMCRSDRTGIGNAAREAEDWIPVLAPLAESIGAPIIAGGVPVCDRRDTPRQIFNSSLVVSPEGELLVRYDKMHLFQLTASEQTVVDETQLYTPGTVPSMFEVGAWHVGLSICYDLRFPELFRQYVPASLMVCTAAFTEETGKCHWEVLLRARAIENQCYVVGVGQCGTHPSEKLRHYGHSMCVDPWGKVVAEAGTSPTCLVVDIDNELVATARERIPALCDLRVVEA